MPDPPSQKVDKKTLQDVFNKSGYYQKVKEGKLASLIRKNNPVQRNLIDNGFDPRSKTQTIIYLDSEGNEIAKVHQYTRPNGTLEASGLPDPKKVLWNGILYVDP